MKTPRGRKYMEYFPKTGIKSYTLLSSYAMISYTR